MKLWAMLLAVVASVCLVLSVGATMTPDYQASFEKKIMEDFNSPQIQQNWRDGIKSEAQASLDHSLVKYTADEVQPFSEKAVIVKGYVTIKLYCYKNDNKVTVIVVREVAGMLDKETGQVLQAVSLSQDIKMVAGWDGIET
jgi:hypothetical protein